MASRFEQRFNQFAIPRLQREFATDVDFILDDDSELRFRAFTDIDQIPSGGEAFTDVDGRLTVKTADLASRSAEFTVLTKARIRDQIYDVYAQAPDHAGLTVFNIRRKFNEQDQSNLFDLRGDQIPFASE
jgi:hypothetical protein